MSRILAFGIKSAKEIWPPIVFFAISMAVVAASNAADSTAAKEMADAVRAQGLACTDPVSAERDAAESKPDEPVWILACQNAGYRVRLMGGMPPKIEQLQ